MLGELSLMEKRWLDALERSVLDTSRPFTAKQALAAIKITKTKKGKTMLRIPTRQKVAYILRLSEDYADINTSLHIQSQDKYWVRI